MWGLVGWGWVGGRVGFDRLVFFSRWFGRVRFSLVGFGRWFGQ